MPPIVRPTKSPARQTPTADGPSRLQKVLAAAGLGSRRQCEELILAGRVEIDRAVVTELGTRADPSRQEIRVDGVKLPQPRQVYFAVHKPPGVLSTSRDPSGRPRVIDLVPYEGRLFTVGRLDMSSEGLILVTNDGELADRLTHPRYGVHKTYHVEVAGSLDRKELEQLRRRAHLAEGFAKVVSAKVVRHYKNSTLLEIVLAEGRNREIRRLLARVGHKVERLKRTAIGPLRLGELGSGQVRPLEREELRRLKRAAWGETERKAVSRPKPKQKKAARSTPALKKPRTVIGGQSAAKGPPARPGRPRATTLAASAPGGRLVPNVRPDATSVAMTSSSELLQSGAQLHRSGQLEEARRLYQQVLEREPNHPDALNLLGMVARQTGQFEQAADYLRRAIAADASQAAYYANLGEALRGLGQVEQAIGQYRRALELAPQAAVAHLQLATLLEQAQQPDDAIAGYERALQLEPQRVETWIRLGSLRRQRGDLGGAEACLRQAITLQPAAALAHFELGNVFQIRRQWLKAIECYQQALQAQPDYPEADCNLGNALREAGQPEAAVEHLRRAVAMRPQLAAAHSNLGASLQDLGRLGEAQQCFERAVELDGGRAELHFNLGTVLKDQAQLTAAIECYDRALALRPDYNQALCSRGMALLSLGRFREGWAAYEHRVGCVQFDTLKFDVPQWSGEPLAGRRLLVQCEQGFGDTLQFIRYLPRVRQAGGEVIVAAQAALVPLLEQSGYGPLVDRSGPLPPFDLQVPLLSLPKVFGTELETVPADIPYLKADPARVERLRAELEQYPGFKIGIAWQGRPSFRGDRLRSIPLECFAPLARVKGMRLFSLQKGPGSEQLPPLAERLAIVDLAASLDNEGLAFVDTAAVMMSLDLVISSDTVIAHLAGALGVPVGVALSAAPDWRWMYDRDDSPWYPTMRLFRQTTLGQWSDVFERMAQELEKLGR